eukprot:CAMPEP_0172301350 /NCGR_PEP_ID=MMETSP1058-20130122/3257_1 /TAXON_ID=83371 /ORGANISM="Detonula confervacea, Strain CCMP 353" /LENGTH=352 /DNA_ID=CAMNT_0013011425 /DNA_START=64 /DNA_END=1122 /DNA_ORIENTATION=-
MAEQNDTSDANIMEAEATDNAAESAGATANSGENDEEGDASGEGTGNDDVAADSEVDEEATTKNAVAENANEDDATDTAEKKQDAGAAADDNGKSSHPQEGTSDGDGGSKSDKKRSIEEAKIVDDEPLPTLPLKRARTAYFIFADDKRGEVKKKHQGEGVATIAKAIGQLWSALEPKEKGVYEKTAAQERERVSRDMQRLKDAGLWPEPGSADASGAGGQDDVIFPIGRIRKICKLDPDVKGMSKESALLITKATELFCTKLGKECVTMAQMQNRRKLMPDDVVEVCSIKEAFVFLRSDLIDLRKAQIEEMKENGKDGKSGGGRGSSGGGKAAEESGTVNKIDSYFGKARNS